MRCSFRGPVFLLLLAATFLAGKFADEGGHSGSDSPHGLE